jgi:uncharacterized protein YkwD
MEPGLWAKVASAFADTIRRLNNPYLRPTDAPGPLPTDGTNRRRPYILPMPAPPEPTPGPVTPPAPVVVLGPQPADRAAVIAATTWRVLQAHNRARGAKGLPPYKPDGRLGWSADDVAQDNARRGHLDHFAGQTSTPWTRMAARGVVDVPASENLAMGQPDEATAVADWLAEDPADSYNHRANILSAEYTHMGGSMARAANGMLVWACDYGKLS